MLRADPQSLCRPRSVCLVSGEETGLGERINAWRDQGARVRILHCGRGSRREGFRLDSFVMPPAYQCREVHGGPADRSDHVRLALESLVQREHFDLIEFPTRGGLAFRSVQAKRCGLAFADTLLAVRLEDCASWQRARSGHWPAGPDEVQIDYLERSAFENACLRITPLPALLDHVRRAGWELHPSARLNRANRSTTPLVTVCVPHYNLGRYLPETLASLAEQTYEHLEVIVIDDGSQEASSQAVFARMATCYPRFRFLRQDNAGIGATRNRALAEARGEFFIPVDADNVVRSDLVERLVHGMIHRPDLAALTCYFLAFRTSADLVQQSYVYACRPTGGPHLLGCLRNVYGDACAIYRTDAFRAVGGYEVDRGTSFEDWEAFVKLIHAGGRVDVLPEHLFYYRHLPTGFSRTTDAHANHERVLRQYRRLERLPEADRAALWDVLAGFHRELERQRSRRSLRARLAGRLRTWLATLVPARSGK